MGNKLKNFGNKNRTKIFLLILLVVLINYSKTYSQDFWVKTTGPEEVTIHSLAINSNGDIFAGTDSAGVFRSTDNGESWTNLGIMNYNIYSIGINPNGDILIPTFELGGLFRSTDNGNNWSSLGLNRLLMSIAINSSGDIFVGTNATGIYCSTDNGETWVQINQGLTSYTVTSLIITTSGDIFAGTMYGGIFRSTDNGENWIQFNQGLTNKYVLSLAINSYGNIFAGTSGGGVFRSADYGVNWVQINRGITYNEGLYFRTLAINSDQEIFAGTAAGIFRSMDNGENWIQTNQGLINDDVHSLAINSSGIIFAGTESGIFQSIQSTTAINTEETKIISSFELAQNFPNPFNPVTKIKYSIPNISLSTSSRSESKDEGSQVRLKIFDVLGHEIATLVNEEMPAGNYEVNFDASYLSSGVYFYKLQYGNYVETKKMILMK